MKSGQEDILKAWDEIGRLPPGTCSALAVVEADGKRVIFAGSTVGIFKATGEDLEARRAWQRLPGSPPGVFAIAASPHFSRDHTLLAGAQHGLWISKDGGASWNRANLPASDPAVLALACSAEQAGEDGIWLAGTLEDGIAFSADGGNTWSGRNFGLLDLSIYAIAFSPNFAQDGVAFAASEALLYTTYNHARAWKRIEIPEGMAPILSLAVSPTYPADHTVFLGTEQAGAFRSADEGKSWEKLSLAAGPVNAILIAESRLIAATDRGVFESSDRGDTWRCALELPGAICLAEEQGSLFCGAINQGVWWKQPGRRWKQTGDLPSRAVEGLELSSRFEQDGTAFQYGIQEGIWRTKDGGKSWQTLEEALPALEIYSLAAHPAFDRTHLLAAAAMDSLIISQDEGDNWQTALEGPARRVAFSPDGRQITASFDNGEVWTAALPNLNWKRLAIPWNARGAIIGLLPGNLQRDVIVVLDELKGNAQVWQGKDGQFEEILDLPAVEHGIAALWSPEEATSNQPWFLGYGNCVYKLSFRKGQPVDSSVVFQSEGEGEAILSLEGIQVEGAMRLYACTGKRLFHSEDGKTWVCAHDFGQERAIQVKLLGQGSRRQRMAALLLGGKFCLGEAGA